jgi:hypothetical protein
MKTFRCTTEGNPLPTIRYWYDPWGLMAEMIFFTVLAVALLVLDLAERFFSKSCTTDPYTIKIEFHKRLDTAYATVPYYLERIRPKP